MEGKTQVSSSQKPCVTPGTVDFPKNHVNTVFFRVFRVRWLEVEELGGGSGGKTCRYLGHPKPPGRLRKCKLLQLGLLGASQKPGVSLRCSGIRPRRLSCGIAQAAIRSFKELKAPQKCGALAKSFTAGFLRTESYRKSGTLFVALALFPLALQVTHESRFLCGLRTFRGLHSRASTLAR